VIYKGLLAAANRCISGSADLLAINAWIAEFAISMMT
jgi:hypothetical protein